MSSKPAKAPELEAWRVRPGQKLALDDLDAEAHPASSGERARDEARLAELGTRFGDYQSRLYASKRSAVLLVLQGMDASGKDGVIRRVFSQVSPLGVRAHAFGVPSGIECAHDFLWRVHACAPALGEITVFNRSHYEDVIAARVRKLVPEGRIARRIEAIRAFEALLVGEDTVVLKLFLHISRGEQGERLRERLELPDKRWKLQASDLADRQHWKDFRDAYQDAMLATSTASAPWYVVPANSRFQRDLMVAELLVALLERLDPRYPDSALPASTVIPK